MNNGYMGMGRYGQGGGGISELLPQLQGYGQPGGGVLQPQFMPQQSAGSFMGMPSGVGADTGGFMQGMLGGTNADGTTTNGWGSMALGGVSGLAGAWLGMQQYGLAKEQLAENKRQFELNYGAQKKTTNTRLEDRQRARVASNPGAYQSVGAYMKKNGV